MGIKSFFSGIFGKKRGTESIIGSFPLTEGKTRGNIKSRSKGKRPIKPPPAPKYTGK